MKSRSRGPRGVAVPGSPRNRGGGVRISWGGVVGCGLRGVGWWGADFVEWGDGAHGRRRSVALLDRRSSCERRLLRRASTGKGPRASVAVRVQATRRSSQVAPDSPVTSTLYQPLHRTLYEHCRRSYFYLHLEATNACNTTCVMCPRAAMDRPIRMLSKATFVKVMDLVLPSDILMLSIVG